MSTYCQEGDKPRVIYKIDGTDKVFESKYSPIEVSVERGLKNEYGNKYNAEGKTIKFSNGQESTVIDYRLDSTGQNIQFWSCGNADWDNRQPDGTYPVFYPLTSPIASIDTNKKCPPPTPPQDYILTVKYNGSIIFADRSANPIDFEVICGNCPPGQCEHKTNAYPGYCCVDCASVATRINNLANKSRCCNG